MKNPAIEYINKKTKINIISFNAIRDILNEVAGKEVAQFVLMLNNRGFIKHKNVSEKLVHFFYDFNVALLFDKLIKCKELPYDNDICSALVEAFHFDFFGQGNLKELGMLELISDSPTCFWGTIFGFFREDNPFKLRGSNGLCTFAFYCIEDRICESFLLFLPLTQIFHSIYLENKNYLDEKLLSTLVS